MKYCLENIDANCPIYYYDVIDSTNTEAKRLAASGIFREMEKGAFFGNCQRENISSGNDKILILAEEQMEGRGRRGRSWESPNGTSVSMSLLLRPEISPDRASMLTLVMGLSVVEGLWHAFSVQTQIKWPNDVIINKKKLVGILTEMGMQGMEIEYIVIGVGINVNVVDFPEELVDKATSLRLELGYPMEREKLITAILRAFDRNYQDFLKTQDLIVLQERYEAVMANLNQSVRVLQPGSEYEGTAVGINTMGELLVEKKDGTCEAVYAGEVSVRGLYSYV